MAKKEELSVDALQERISELEAETTGKDQVIKDLQSELKDAGKVAKAGGPVGKLDKKNYEVLYGLVFTNDIGKKTAQEIADSPELLRLCVESEFENVKEL
jgi:hypothetical protein